MTCAAKIRPFTDHTELTCEGELDHDPTEAHKSTLKDYAYPGSRTVLTWMDTDRRTFYGDWESCPVANCILPNRHRGMCTA